MPHPRFFELPVWQAARRLEQTINECTNKGTFRNDWKLRDQIRSSAASVMANIAEGFARRYDREFIQFLFMSKSSTAETQSHLFVALDRGHLDQRTFDDAFASADEVAKQLSGLISYLTGRKKQKLPSSDLRS